MVEEGTTESTTTPAATLTVDEGQPTPPLVNSEGELRENWRDALPEDIRGDKVFERVSNFEGIMKSLSSAERAYGKEKIPIPNEASSEAEWDAYYAAGGRPETAGDYNLTRPEDLPEDYYNQELATAAQELFHKIGLSKKQADALFEFNNSNLISQLTRNAQDAELAVTTLKDGLYKDWGNAYDQRIHFGNVAVNKFTDGNAEFKERLVQKFGNDPDFIRYSANIGMKYKEGNQVDTSGIIPTTADLETRIKEEMSKPVHGKDYAKHGFTREQHQDQIKLVSRMFAEKAKSIKTG